MIEDNTTLWKFIPQLEKVFEIYSSVFDSVVLQNYIRHVFFYVRYKTFCHIFPVNEEIG